MNGVFKLALSNMRKRKGGTIALMLVIAVTTILIIVGSTMMTQMKSFLRTKTEALNGAHFMCVQRQDYFNDDYINYVTNDKRTIETEVESVIGFREAKIEKGDGSKSGVCIIEQFNQDRKISKTKIIEKQDGLGENVVYLPYITKISLGAKVGDVIDFVYENKKIQMRIGGYIEDNLTSASGMCVLRMVLEEEFYDKFYSQITDRNKYERIYARFDDIDYAEEFSPQFEKDIIQKAVLQGQPKVDVTIGYADAEMGATMFINIMSGVVISFAFITLIVVLIVMAFSITNSITSNIKEYGTLKALGYTGKQILASMALHYLIVAGVGAIVGAILGIFIIPLLGGLISSTVGLAWREFGKIHISLIAFLIVEALVFIIILIAGKKINSITPLTALREGAETHCFKKNRVSLDGGVGSVATRLGVKSLANNIKQAVSVGVIAMFLMFMCGVVLICNYNFNVKKDQMKLLAGMPYAPRIEIQDTAKVDEVLKNVSNIAGVKQTYQYGMMQVSIQDRNVVVVIGDDVPKLINTVARGSAPEADNEIAVNTILLKKLGKKMGDTIKVTNGKNEKEYLICGETQQVENLGKIAYMTESGYKSLDKTYVASSFVVKMEDGYDFKHLVSEMGKIYAPNEVVVYDVVATIDNVIGSFETSFLACTIAFIIVTIFIVWLILYLLISTKLVKERKQIAILKSLGYSTSQIVKQMLISFIPTLIIGIVAGLILSIVASGATINLFMSSVGVIKLTLVMPILTIIVLAIGLVVVGVVATIAYTLRVRKIAPYELLAE